jgi:hypothetical protein
VDGPGDIRVAEEIFAALSRGLLAIHAERFLGGAVDRRQPAMDIKGHHAARDALEDIFVVAFDVLRALLGKRLEPLQFLFLFLELLGYFMERADDE